MKKLITLFVLFISFSHFGQTPDPGVPGAYAVSNQEYDFGDAAFGAPSFPDLIEVRGSVYYPTDMSEAPFPVILILHGRHSTCYSGGSTNISWPCTGSFSAIPSYQGYAYFAEHMASHGYIVISVSANSISSTDNSTLDYGMKARGELLYHHLSLWNEWNTSGGYPFGSYFEGKLDLSRIGILGHSRGGEGVVEHALLNRKLGGVFGIKAVLTLAPVDFNRPVLNGIALMNIAPYCDGDVSDLQGVHFYDDARYLDPSDITPKHNLVSLGANHNYYNTVWTPGLFPAGTGDDWGYVDGSQTDKHCGTSAPGNGRLTPLEQRNSLIAYGGAFFRVYVGEEMEFEPILTVQDVLPPVSSTLDGDEIFMSYHPGQNKRIDINRTDNESTKTLNTVGEDVSQNGLVTYNVCGDGFGKQYCIGAGAGPNQEPHNKYGGVVKLGLSQLELKWNSPDDWYQNNVPDFLSDISQFHSLQFRASVNFDTSPLNTPLNFKVELTDKSGASSSLAVQDYSKALYFPVGKYGSTLPRIMHNTISVPIADFSGIDITDIDYIRFIFTESSSGAIFVSDLMFASDNDVLFPPVAAFKANSKQTCTGEISFTDNSTFSPTSWNWDFGDGSTSTDQNPNHTYVTNGIYTVMLTVTNDAGSDFEKIKSYIEVVRPIAPIAENVSLCSPGEITLNATGTGGELMWYNAAVDGTLLGTGPTYSQTITETTSFYVQESVENVTLSVGPVDNVFGSGGYFGANDWRGIFFDAHAPFVLESVKVYANKAGDRKIEVLDGEGGEVVHSKIVYISVGESVVDLGFMLDVHDHYFLKVTGLLVDLYRATAGSSYPYELPGVVSLTGSNASGGELDYYYYFFDWKIREMNCLSARTEVSGIIFPDFAVTVSDDVTIASGETTVLSASGGVGYSWMPITGLSDPSAATTEASPTETTIYTVTVTNSEGCEAVESVTVFTEGYVGLETKGDEAALSIHPNPSTGVITIANSNVNIPFTMTVFDAEGRLVLSKIIDVVKPELVLDLSDFERGMYYLQLSNEIENLREKIVLQ